MRGAREAEDEFVLPVGTVTLLLADIEGSSRLWERDAEVMTAAVARLENVIAELIGRHRGVRPVEQGEGDSFLAAFSRASDAITAALEVQRADLGPIRLRVGINTGEVQLREQITYAGAAVNRTARLRDLAHGGQTVLSAATHQLVQDGVPDGCTLLDLGTYRLRDLARPERVYQLCHPDLRDAFPPLRSLDAFPHNLPVQLTSFIGRAEEVREVRGLVEQHRALTLTGTGGCGKTRLALQVAADMVATFPDGVWVAELAPLSDPALVGPVVIRALGLQDEPFRTATETITHHIAAKTALVVLDNCEHMVEEAAALTEAVLRSCPSITILATSREALGVTGEVAWLVPSLSVPEVVSEPAPIEGVTSSEAVELFVDRARRARPTFTLDDSSADAVAEICRRLDGVPLAIELAAARVRVLSPERIAASLGDAFRVLAGGARTAVPRQQTLRASIEWSHDLLSDPERGLFRRLGVFAGSFDLDAAESVGVDGGIEAHHVLDHLSLLVDKSLVQTDNDRQGDLRYRLLETVRQYARERLELAGELEATQARHRDHYLAFAEVGEVWRREGYDAAWMDRMEADFDNLRVAFSFSYARGDAEEAVRLPHALAWPSTARGRQAEVHAWLEQALPAARAIDPVMRARALTMAAISRWMSSMPGELAFAEEAVGLLRRTDDERTLCAALAALGHARCAARREYRDVLDEAIELARRSGEPASLRWALSALAWAAHSDDPVAALACAEELPAYQFGQDGGGFLARSDLMLVGMLSIATGPLPRAADLLSQVVTRAGDAGDTYHFTVGSAFEAVALASQGDIDGACRSAHRAIDAAVDMGVVALSGMARTALGLVAVVSGDADGALEHMAEGWPYVAMVPAAAEAHLGIWVELAIAGRDIATARALVEQGRGLGTNARWHYGSFQLGRARLAVIDGDTRLAEDLVHEALSTWCEQQAWGHAPHALDMLGQIAADQESYDEATRLMGAATTLHEAVGSVRFATRLPDHERAMARARAELGEERFAAAWEAGMALSAGEAASYAARGRGERKRPSIGWASLTPTELEVVGLVAEGLPNKEIAARLFMSPRTVQTHLTHVYAKLGLSSRVQLAQAGTRAAAAAKQQRTRRSPPMGATTVGLKVGTAIT